MRCGVGGSVMWCGVGGSVMSPPPLRLPEPHDPSIVELLWCYSSYRTIPWERRWSSIRVTRRSSWQFMMRAAADDNRSKPGAVCSQVSWWVTQSTRRQTNTRFKISNRYYVHSNSIHYELL